MVNRDTTQKARFEDLKSLAFGSVGAAFAAVGVAIADECEICIVHNATDTDAILSFDGVNEHCYLAAYSQRVIDYRTNDKVIGNRTVFYVKHNGAAPTLGAIYIEVTF